MSHSILQLKLHPKYGVPLLPIRVCGWSDAPEETITGVVDTGFNGFLIIPQSVKNRLDLPEIGSDSGSLPNGVPVSATAYRIRATVDLSDESRTLDTVAVVHDQEHSDNVPILIGLAFLRAFGLGFVFNPPSDALVVAMPGAAFEKGA